MWPATFIEVRDPDRARVFAPACAFVRAFYAAVVEDMGLDEDEVETGTKSPDFLSRVEEAGEEAGTAKRSRRAVTADTVREAYRTMESVTGLSDFLAARIDDAPPICETPDEIAQTMDAMRGYGFVRALPQFGIACAPGAHCLPFEENDTQKMKTVVRCMSKLPRAISRVFGLRVTTDVETPPPENEENEMMLGEGAYGEVRKTQNARVVVKRHTHLASAYLELVAEIVFRASGLECAHVTRTTGVFVRMFFPLLEDGTPSTRVEVALFCEMETLRCAIDEMGWSASPARVSQFALQLIEGIQFIHAHGFVHMDLYPNNVMMSYKPMRLVVIDFGCFERACGENMEYERERVRGLMHEVMFDKCPGALDEMEAKWGASDTADWFPIAARLLFATATGRPPEEYVPPRASVVAAEDAAAVADNAAFVMGRLLHAMHDVVREFFGRDE